ncbi:reverse transcriptase domain-containing protein [bacterium]|nr:reverse transcriptase domain-containing protein [bacterium]
MDLSASSAAPARKHHLLLLESKTAARPPSRGHAVGGAGTRSARPPAGAQDAHARLIHDLEPAQRPAPAPRRHRIGAAQSRASIEEESMPILCAAFDHRRRSVAGWQRSPGLVSYLPFGVFMQRIVAWLSPLATSKSISSYVAPLRRPRWWWQSSWWPSESTLRARAGVHHPTQHSLRRLGVFPAFVDTDHKKPSTCTKPRLAMLAEAHAHTARLMHATRFILGWLHRHLILRCSDRYDDRLITYFAWQQPHTPLGRAPGGRSSDRSRDQSQPPTPVAAERERRPSEGEAVLEQLLNQGVIDRDAYDAQVAQLRGRPPPAAQTRGAPAAQPGSTVASLAATMAEPMSRQPAQAQHDTMAPPPPRPPPAQQGSDQFAGEISAFGPNAMDTDATALGADGANGSGGGAAAAEPPAAKPLFENEPGALRFYYPSDMEYADRKKIDNYQIIGTYHMEAVTLIAIGVEMPPMPTHGVMPHGATVGPYIIFFPYTQCKAFAERIKTVEAEATDGSLVTLHVGARKIIDPAEITSSVPLTLPASFLDTSCGFLEIYLEEQPMAFLHTDDIVAHVKSMNIHVFKKLRGQSKMKDGDEWIPMGPEARTNLINMDIKPVNNSIANFDWPAVLEVQQGERVFFIPYRLGGPGSELFCSSRKGCKRLLSGGACTTARCPENPSAEAAPTGGKERARPRPQPAAEAAEKRQARSEQGMSAFMAKFATQAQTPCPWLAEGVCVRGLRCKYLHAGDAAAWATITCKLKRSRGGVGVCAAHPHCIYKQCHEISTAARADAGAPCMPYHAMSCHAHAWTWTWAHAIGSGVMRPRCCRPRLTIPRRNTRHAPAKFIYGTEVIRFALPPTRLMSHNLAGVKGGTRLRQAFAAARSMRADVFLAQEHGLHTEDAARLKDTAHEFGFWVEASYIGAEDTRGGTWVALNMNTFRLRRSDVLPRNRQTLGGRVTVVHVPADRLSREAASPESESVEASQPYASVYVPQQSQLRRVFLDRLAESKLLSRTTILGADRNTVRDLSLDVRYESKPPQSYRSQNAHAAKFDTLMANYGLTDIFRQLEGKHARSYTRLGETVHTRIDCIFGPKKSDKYQWYSYRVTSEMHGSTWQSDHMAIVTELKRVEKATIGPGRPRVEASLFTCEESVRNMKALYQEIKEAYPTDAYGHAAVMQKQLVSAKDLLHRMSVVQRRKEMSAYQYVRTRMDKNVQQRVEEGPNQKLKASFDAMRSALRKCKKAARAPTAADAHRRVAFEEVSTKQFHSKFKQKGVKRYVQEMYATGKENGLPNLEGPTTSDPVEMCGHAARYYETLMSRKPSDTAAAATLESKLKEKTLSDADRKKLDGKITPSEVRRAVRRLAKGKSPGPDGLPAEYFHVMEDVLADDLAAYYNEIYDDRYLTDNMLMGEIILLYKKKDPRDVRNYRPITLLNVEYKILTKILVERLKQVIERIICAAQTGFVPGRRIQWNTHLLNLVEAYLDETDEDGLLIFLDWEKAFDRCSWDYMHIAAKALGLGTTMCEWMRMLYNADRPAHRRVGVNGFYSDYFALGSGTAQGCPASPIIFLLIAEGLSRLILDDPEWRGIVVQARHDLRLSQFADDTVLLVRDFLGMRRIWPHIRTYEQATGGLANVTKFEGLPLGRMRRQANPRDYESRITVSPYILQGGQVKLGIHVPKGRGIKWCKKGEYLISLGMPHGWDFDPGEFFMSKYTKCKELMSTWHDVERMSPHGSALVANSHVYGRFRYYISGMVMPKEISKAIQSDVQQLVWGKEVLFEPDELGSGPVRRFILEGAQYLPRRELGIGLLCWEAHSQALAAITLFHYIGPGEPLYKTVLDAWFARTTEGRGAIFSTLPVKELTRPLGQRQSKLPHFFSYALRCLRELTSTLVPTGPGPYISPDEAKAEPFWSSMRINVRCRDRGNSWRDDIQLHRVQDLIDHDRNAPCTEERMEAEYEEALETDGRYVVTDAGRDLFGRRQYDRIPFERLHRDWRSFIMDARDAIDIATGKSVELYRYSEQARSMMQRMGWRPGAGLGKLEDGRTSPIPTPNPPRVGGRGGAAGAARLQGGGKKPVLYAHEQQPGEMVYGTIGNRNGAEVLEVWEVSPRGVPTPTKQVVKLVQEWGVRASELRRALLWDGGPVGVAETFYPHPAGWRFEGEPPGSSLENMTVRRLTALFRRKHVAMPSCLKKWATLTGADMTQVQRRLTSPLLTPRDFKNYYRVLHRSIRTRNICPGEHTLCRLCGRYQERFSHLGRCWKLRRTFREFRSLAQPLIGRMDLDDKLIYLGVRDTEVLPGALSDLHIILWKFILIAFTRAETNNERYKPRTVWKQAVCRYVLRVRARTEGLRQSGLRRDCRGSDRRLSSRERERWESRLAPLARVGEFGELEWVPAMAAAITAARARD